MTVDSFSIKFSLEVLHQTMATKAATGKKAHDPVGSNQSLRGKDGNEARASQGVL